MPRPSTDAAPYLERVEPSSGRVVPARAHLTSDAGRGDLGGTWDFRWFASADAAARASADSPWQSIEVPGHWVLHPSGAYGRPAYTNVDFPFPLDPPHVPDANPTADHRRTFEVPAAWLDAGRVWLRFDGIESLGHVSVNGAEVGVVRGSRLRTEFDVTDVVRPGTNTLDVRVHQWSAMTYVEDQDQWWLPGIFREVTLLHRPAGGLDDVWVNGDFDPESGVGTLALEVRCAPDAYPLTVACAELGWHAPVPDADAPHRFELGRVQPWSADVPRLYDVTVASAAETVTVRTGFRRVEVRGDAWLVNGRRVRLRGVNRHDFDPRHGRVVDPDALREQLCLMKRHNINAVRTAHYPPHPALLALADEIGLWVINECDLETHGFERAGWRGNPSDDPAWRAVYLDRAARMFERDKNHPCVIAWSLGNESGAGANLGAMAAWLRRRDPSRPLHYENDHTDRVADVVSRMYSPVEELERLTRVRTQPIVLCEYAHAMGNGAGGLAEYEATFDAHPALHGGFVWEWRDHGLLTTTADGVAYHAYGGDFGEPWHDGSFVCDGMLLADGTPSPMLAEFAAVVTPLKVGLTPAQVTVENRRHDGSTADCVVAWVHEVDGHRVASGTVSLCPVQPGATASVPLPDLDRTAPGEHWLTVTAHLADDAPWAPAGHVIATAQLDLGRVPTPAPRRHPRSAARASGDGFTLGRATFDHAGRLTDLGGLPVADAEVTLWRAPTENDVHQSFGSYEVGPPELTGGLGAPAPSSAARWRAAGLHALVPRLLSLDAAEDLRTVRRLAGPNSADFVTVDQRWAWHDGALHLDVDVTPSHGWQVTWPRVGVHLALPAGYADAAWFGTGPHENYPDSRAAARIGRFAAAVDDLGVAYAVPQESGHRADLRELTLTGPGLPTLRVTTTEVAGRRPGFVVARHDALAVTAAAHPHELPASTATHLYLDLAQHGLGSRACGPDVLPRHALWPRPLSASLRFEVAGGE